MEFEKHTILISGMLQLNVDALKRMGQKVLKKVWRGREGRRGRKK
jgi:hypothetical protein